MSGAVDVVIPLRGPQPWIRECFDSLAAQTEPAARVIVVDDGIDGPETAEAGRQLFGARFGIVANAGRGVASAINTGVAASRADWILRIDGDDVCHAGRLAAQRRFLEQHWPRFAGCGAGNRIIDRAGRVLAVQHSPSDPAVIAAQMHRRCNFLGPSMMVRRDVFAAHPLRPALASVEDYDFALRAWEGGRLANLAEVLVDYRVHSSQQSFDKRVRQTALAELAVRAALRRAQGAADPLDADPGLVEAFVRWRLAGHGYASLRTMLTALRYVKLHATHDGRDALRYLGIALRAALPALPAYPLAWTIVRSGYAGLAAEKCPFAALNVT